MLRDTGKNGFLGQLAALVLGNPKLGSRHPTTLSGVRYQADLQDVVSEDHSLNPSVLVVFGSGIGYADPQYNAFCSTDS